MGEREEPTAYPKYLEARIREALAEDPRTNLLDVQVEITGRRVFVMGTVESEELRAAAQHVIEERLPADTSVLNELWVASYTAPSDKESLP